MNDCAQNQSMQKVMLDDDGTGYMWRILTQPKDGGEKEEVVFMVNGIISSLDLPPLYRLPK